MKRKKQNKFISRICKSKFSVGRPLLEEFTEVEYLLEIFIIKCSVDTVRTFHNAFYDIILYSVRSKMLRRPLKHLRNLHTDVASQFYTERILQQRLL